LAESDAADVAQTTWLRLLEHIDRIQYPDRVGSWLAATARNECLRNLAAHKRVVLVTRMTISIMRSPMSLISMRVFLLTNALRSFTTPCRAFPGDGSDYLSCSWLILRLPMPRYPISSGFRLAASGPPADVASHGCASRSRPPNALPRHSRRTPFHARTGLY
jgi:hypothetical protein